MLVDHKKMTFSESRFHFFCMWIIEWPQEAVCACFFLCHCIRISFALSQVKILILCEVPHVFFMQRRVMMIFSIRLLTCDGLTNMLIRFVDWVWGKLGVVLVGTIVHHLFALHVMQLLNHQQWFRRCRILRRFVDTEMLYIVVWFLYNNNHHYHLELCCQSILWIVQQNL